jgi:hypothetical protein
MEEYLKNRIKNYKIALEKIQQAIEECSKNDLWDIIKNLEKGKLELINLIEEDEKLLSKK